jgi:type I restriction enzyme M protein
MSEDITKFDKIEECEIKMKYKGILGAIIGDIVGSRFEWNNRKSKDFEFLTNECFYTDDSVLTIAIGQALLECNKNYAYLSEKTISKLHEFGTLYPDAGYGGSFCRWLLTKSTNPYNSWGNGAAMRVSACAYFANSLDEAMELSHKVTCVTHNHPEGLKGAEATTVATYMALHGSTKEEIRQYILDNYYQIDFTIDSIRDYYDFDVSCQGSVPQALQAFFESESYEDAIRNAISIGGDSDTIAAITGAVAGAYYGIPDDIKEKASSYLNYHLQTVVNNIDNKIRDKF